MNNPNDSSSSEFDPNDDGPRARFDLEGQPLAMLAGAMASLSVPIAIVCREGKAHWANAAFRRLIGFGEASVAGCFLPSVLSCSPGSAAERSLLENLRGGVSFQQMLRIDVEGGIKGLSLEADVIEEAGGAGFALRCAVRDLHSPAVRASVDKLEAARDLFREITGANKELEQALDQARSEIGCARSESEAKTAFLANMSHEIRTPMNAVIGFCDLLLNTKLDDEQGEYVEAIYHSGQLLIKLIGQVLDYSKIESGHWQLEVEEVSLDQLLLEVQAIMGTRLRNEDLEFRIDIEGVKQDAVLGDATRIKQILINVLGNAFKFTPKGHIGLTARTSLSPLQGHVCLAVRVEDSGIGIEPGRLKSLFAPFAQAHEKVAKDYGGTGLGLAICRRLCQEMHGDIWVESTSRKRGTVFAFEIHLPLLKAAGESAETGGARSASAKGSEMQEKTQTMERERRQRQSDEPLRLLVVDDNPNNLLITSKLSQHLGYDADAVASGVEALSKMKEGSYDIVLMDVRMAPINGIETTQLIRKGEAGEHCSSAYIIAVTAHALQGDREKCLKSGMNDYLSKPLTLERLEASLTRACSELSLD